MMDPATAAMQKEAELDLAEKEIDRLESEVERLEAERRGLRDTPNVIELINSLELEWDTHLTIGVHGEGDWAMSVVRVDDQGEEHAEATVLGGEADCDDGFFDVLRELARKVKRLREED